MFRALQDSGPPGTHPLLGFDSTLASPKLDDPVIRIVQWVFQRPPWVMWGGAILAAVIATVLLWTLWRRRTAIAQWLSLRSLGLKFLMAAGALALLLAVAGMGYRTNNFVERDNRFCSGCHIFVGSNEARVLPDTGDYSLVNRMEGKHDTLSCHACHQLYPLKEAVKMLYWMSGVRDKEIPPHAKVPRNVCERCHVTGDAKKTWQAIAATAGHRTHLESDSSALKGKIECLTCHAQTAHRFKPANTTCAQAGCHAAPAVQIKLGRMSSQTATHCIVCHQFTAKVPALATRDSAETTLIPKSEQCFSCHQMRGRLASFAPERDPHKATCGMCHDPHKQETPAAAAATCASAGCHADWKKNPFHTGAAHRGLATQPGRCITCHVPHSARVDASDCTGCHTSVREGTKGAGALRPPLPFDTTRALRRVSLEPAPLVPLEHQPRSLGDGPPPDDPPGIVANAAAAAPPAAASFSHAPHRRHPCLTCHTNTSKRGTLTFERPRGCQICHHQAAVTSRCETCHAAAELSRPIAASVAVTVGTAPVHQRAATFAHSAHTSRACTDCHTMPVTLAPGSAVVTCQSCHEQHHADGPACTACHNDPDIRPAHARPVAGHRACDACHGIQTVARLVPNRQLCLTCHAPQTAHYAERECTTCHFQQTPSEYRAHLVRGARS